MWETLREAIDEEMEADPTVLVMGAPPSLNAHRSARSSFKVLSVTCLCGLVLVSIDPATFKQPLFYSHFHPAAM